MSTPAAPSSQGTSTRPYLVRALHDWCTDNGFTPYVAVFVDAGVQVPVEYVKNNEIVLNISFEATSSLKLGNEYIEFKARFGGVSRDIMVPIDHVIAIYARENGQGMAFPAPTDAPETVAPALVTEAAPRAKSPRLSLADAPTMASSSDEPARQAGDGTPPEPPPTGGRPSLKRIK